jgi:hypothetical protein
MNSSDFSALIGRLEREADVHPQLYVGKVAVAAALGYLVPALIALELLAVCLAIASSLLSGGHPSILTTLAGFAGVAAAIATIRALRVTIAEPHGLQVTREHAPQLFALIDDISARLETAPLASITIDGEPSMGIRQIPRWGIFGGYRNHLQLGVPLLIALSVDDFTALLTHELAHLGGKGRQFAPWIYRQRPIWNLLRQKFATPGNAFDRLLAVFYGWYAPWFYAYSFALARKCEYEADHIAATITSAEIHGRALIKLELARRFLADVFWARFLARIEEAAEPPYRPFSLLPRAFKIAQSERARPQWLAEALRRYATDGDTHPSLAERLAALEVPSSLPASIPEPVALALFGSLAPQLIHHCDEVWRAENLANWRKRHDEIRETRWKLAQYEQHDESALGAEDLWTKANLLLTVNRDAEAIDTLQVLVARPDKYPDAYLLLGRLLLAQGEESGLAQLLTAIELNVELASSAGSLGYAYLVDRGRKSEAMRFHQRVRQLSGE